MATAPTRACVLTLRLQADTRHELAAALYDLATQIELGAIAPGNGASGGVGSGYTYDFSETEWPTHAEYVAALRQYLAAARA